MSNYFVILKMCTGLKHETSGFLNSFGQFQQNSNVCCLWYFVRPCALLTLIRWIWSARISLAVKVYLIVTAVCICGKSSDRLGQALLSYVPQFSAVFSFWNLFGLTATLIYFFWWRRPHSKFPPGPRGFPLLGVIPFFGPLPGVDLKKWSVEKYGPVMSARFGRDEVVVLNTFDVINQAFVKQSASFSDRPWIELFCGLTKHDGLVFMKYGDAFKAQKHFALKFLRDKGIARRQIEDVLNDEGDRFVEFLKTKNSGPVDLKTYFYWLTSNVISQTALGKRHDYGDKNFIELLDVMRLMFTDPRDAKNMGLINLFGFLVNIPPFTTTMKRFEKRMQFVLDTMQTNIDEHKKRFDPNNIDDFIDAFLYEREFGKRKDLDYSDSHLRAFCRDLFLAGSETSSTTLSWLILHLLNFPECEKLILKEIDEAFGSDGLPTMSKKDDLPMTCAFIQETLRSKTLVPLGIHHLTTNQTELLGHVIPKGTIVTSNLYGANMDPKDWPNPKQFNPRRHIDENGKFVLSNKVIPFSIGARFCLGESLARAELFVFFVKMLQKFRIRSATQPIPSIDEEVKSVVVAAVDFKVYLQSRN